MEVYLIRHTAPKIEEGVCYGQTDISLANSFEKEAEVLLKTLPKVFDAVFSSPATRCAKLAKRIISKQMLIDKRLLEMNFGDWEMEKWDEIDKKLLDAWMTDFIHVRVPGGESFTDLYDRVTDFLEELVKHDYKKVAVVTHGGVIRCCVASAKKMKLQDAFQIEADFTSVTKIFF